MKRAAVLLIALWPGVARAYMLESSITSGCHERLTAVALRTVRAELGLPPVAPSRDEQALIADLPFSPAADLGDLAGVSLLLGVRENDLKGNSISRIADLVPIHGDPAAQREHCLRAPTDDEPTGTASALAACAAYIHETAMAALDGLGADGRPDETRVAPLAASLALRGRVEAPLPIFYVRMGQALHALQDGFSHSFRTGDDGAVGTLLNWVDFAEERFIERRDGPAHVAALDACDHLDPMRAARFARAQMASTALLRAVLEPDATAEAKSVAVEALLAEFLPQAPGCDFQNQWCHAPERAFAQGSGCECAAAAGECASSTGGTVVVAWLAAGVVLTVSRRRGCRSLRASSRRRRRLAPALLLLLVVTSRPAVAGGPNPEPELDDVPLTPAELAALRDVRGLGPRLGLAVSFGGSLDRAAAAGSVGGRFRLNPRWLVGVDAEWNPWIISHPLGVRRGVASAYATVIRRFPMRFERVNLRTTLHAGVSVLLFDLYGAREGSMGPFFGIAPLGIDVHLRRGWMLVLDPLELELPIPHVTGVPLYYEQFRLMIGLQYGG